MQLEIGLCKRPSPCGSVQLLDQCSYCCIAAIGILLCVVQLANKLSPPSEAACYRKMEKEWMICHKVSLLNHKRRSRAKHDTNGSSSSSSFCAFFINFNEGLMDYQVNYWCIITNHRL